MYRVLAALALVLAGFLASGPLSPRSQAFESWCVDDPVVSINGRLLDIQVQMPTANVLSMRNTSLTVIIPSNLSGAVLVDDVSAFPMKTTISLTGPAWHGAGAIPVTIRAYVTAGTSYTTRIVSTPLLALNMPLLYSASTSGQTNSLITLHTSR